MKKIVFALLCSAAISAPAMAANAGAYVAADLGLVSYSGASVPGQPAGAYPNPGSMGIGGGYHFTRTFSVEAAYSTLGESSVSYPNATSALKVSVLELAAVGAYAINNQFNVFGKLGVASVSAKVSGAGAATGLTASASKSNLMFGFGAHYSIDRHFGVRAQYENFGKAKFTATQGGFAMPASSIGVAVISAGVDYNF